MEHLSLLVPCGFRYATQAQVLQRWRHKLSKKLSKASGAWKRAKGNPLSNNKALKMVYCITASCIALKCIKIVESIKYVLTTRNKFHNLPVEWTSLLLMEQFSTSNTFVHYSSFSTILHDTFRTTLVFNFKIICKISLQFTASCMYSLFNKLISFVLIGYNYNSFWKC